MKGKTLITILILVILVSCSSFSPEKQIEGKWIRNEASLEQKYPELKQYIQENRKAGYSDNAIEKAILQAGYEPKGIEEIDNVHGAKFVIKYGVIIMIQGTRSFIFGKYTFLDDNTISLKRESTKGSNSVWLIEVKYPSSKTMVWYREFDKGKRKLWEFIKK